MRGEAMKRVCQNLITKNIELSSFDALEFFAREGDWQTKSYYPYVKSLVAWEIDPVFEKGLNKNIPNAEIVIGNSFTLAKEEKYKNRFDFIVLDNPQNVYGSNEELCEHFDALPLIPFLSKPNSILIMNVNKHPFNYSRESKWAKRRNSFYGLQDGSILSEGFLSTFYSRYFKEQLHLNVSSIDFESRNNEYLSYIIIHYNKG